MINNARSVGRVNLAYQPFGVLFMVECSAVTSSKSLGAIRLRPFQDPAFFLMKWQQSRLATPKRRVQGSEHQRLVMCKL